MAFRSFCFSSLLLTSSILSTTFAQGNGYIGYNLEERGDPESAVFETANTPANVSTTDPPPDVFLNASVTVGEIDIEVDNLSAQINLQAQVLSLLNFNAGVSASVDQVQLTIQNITAKVLLEARLSNLVTMIGDVLDSIDLNPVIATLGQDVGKIVNTTAGALGGSGTSSVSGSTTSTAPAGNSTLAARGAANYDLEHGILYSINDYSGNKHTNMVLQQDGNVVNQNLDNQGHVSSTTVVGSYKTLMGFNGYSMTTEVDGASAREEEYTYSPVPGVTALCAIFIGDGGSVVETRVLSESKAGGGSTIDGELRV